MVWDKHRVPLNRHEMLNASATLRELCPAFFRATSDKDIRSLTREFFAVGWSAADIERALSTMPDGSPWPHDTPVSPQELQRIRPWVKYRLSAWKGSESAPVTSYWQRKWERQKIERLKRRAARASEVLTNVVRWAEIELTRNCQDYKQASGYREARQFLNDMFSANRENEWKKRQSRLAPIIPATLYNQSC